MSNQWLRLWHDMPTDPKWRTVARASKQSISLVQAVYIHLLVAASRNVTRGHADVTVEDLASALDVTETDIQAVIDAMQGRVLAGFELTGWETRQPKREDHGDPSTGAKSPAERKREQRARDAEKDHVTSGHAESRNVTTDRDKEEDKEKKKPAAQAPSDLPDWLPLEAWEGYVEMRRKNRKPMTPRARVLVLKSLTSMAERGIDVAEALDNSTRQNWTDVYEPKSGSKGSNGTLKAVIV